MSDALPPRLVQRLLLVYNARSGKAAALLDSARKLFGGGCSLCRITHGLATEKDAWRDCRERLGVPVDGLHTDELSARERAVLPGLPAVLAEVAAADTGCELVCLAGPEALAGCRDEPEALESALRRAAQEADLELP